ncbi:MAG TPA: cytochrome o ubiquinol oxidase subunit IV [Steroidobacteraceae bacterium]|jgi:cytochrome o ubiquinol oxidase operon protein cyoD
MSSNPDEFVGSHVGEDHVVGGPPGEVEPPTLRTELRGYVIGLALAAALTAASFWSIDENLIYGPGIVMALIVFGLAQVGVHLVFFLHLTTAPDNTNNALALAFGVLIVSLIFVGSVWVMYHLNHNVIPASALMHMRGG